MSKGFYHKRIAQPFFSRKILISIGGALVFALILYWFPEMDNEWVVFLFLVGFVFACWANIKDFFDKKKEARKILAVIKKVEHEQGIDATEYSCSKALVMKNYEDEGHFYALQIAPDQVLFWLDNDFSESYNFPNSHFEVLANEELRPIFGYRIRALGDAIHPIFLSPEIKRESYELIPEHGTVLPGTIEDFLETLAKHWN
ncbi:hypothetical protein [Lewinella sp. LCG006]|uniref:hypothetical protein n=1 Tax=Lewinella sp. LCG006 TaxID=3231911 RepID=UPI00345F9A08